MVRRLLLLSALLFCSTPARAEITAVVGGAANCGSPSNGKLVSLDAGTYPITLTGAYSNWSINSENGGNTWVTGVRARIVGSGTDLVCYSGGWKANASAAAAAVAGLSWDLVLTTPGQVRFWIDDSPCGDNRGSVTVHIDLGPVATDPTTWGAIKRLLPR